MAGNSIVTIEFLMIPRFLDLPHFTSRFYPEMMLATQPISYLPMPPPLTFLLVVGGSALRQVNLPSHPDLGYCGGFTPAAYTATSLSATGWQLSHCFSNPHLDPVLHFPASLVGKTLIFIRAGLAVKGHSWSFLFKHIL